MCDYSLHNVRSRPAKVEDKLVSTTFCNSITRGFAAVGEPNVAVCLLPGTEVAFENDVECKRGWGLLPNRKLARRRSLVSGRSILTSRVSITMPWSFQMGRSCL